MNKNEQQIDKFEYKKILDAQARLTSAMSTLKVLNDSLKYEWVQEVIDELKLVDHLLDQEMCSFLSERYMLGYSSDSADYVREPELMAGRIDNN